MTPTPAAPAAPKYYVLAESTCPACGGTKIFVVYDEHYKYDVDCDHCNGKGVVEPRAPLEDALRELEISGSIFLRGLE